MQPWWDSGSPCGRTARGGVGRVGDGDDDDKEEEETVGVSILFVWCCCCLDDVAVSSLSAIQLL